MAQYKHDRFFKYYIQSLYKTKGDTIQNIQVHNDEDLEIDLMFIGREDIGWEQENLGLFDRLMREHPTIIIEHYSGYLDETDILTSITRKNLYWTQKYKALKENAKTKQAKELIDNQNPFTWILTVNCSKNKLTLAGAQADSDLGVGVYLLPEMFRMGIVVIDQLDDEQDTIWLKMLGNSESAKQAFKSIKQLSSNQREKNDIISTCLKYCFYLRGLASNNLTIEEEDFMKTMEEIDAWYQAEMNKAESKGKLEGKLESVTTAIRVKFGAKALTPQIVSQLQKLNAEQLDNFIAGMFNWQQLQHMEEWLNSSDKV
jgi:hypothetical protein